MHYFQFHIGDYATHTRHLTLLEDLAYRRMLDLYYLHERPLNESPTVVARLIGMRDHVAEVETILNEFFRNDVLGWVNDRVEREIGEFQAKAEAASRAGKASAERRRNDRSTTVQPTNNHKPITNNQEPITKNQEPETKEPKTKSQKPKVAAPADDELQATCREIWKSYAAAYASRYGVDPLRNAKVNSLVKQFARLVPADEAPAIAAHYVGHNGQFYVAKLHPLEALVSDAAKLRTEWATGTAMTTTRARQADRTGSMLSIVEELKRERGEA